MKILYVTTISNTVNAFLIPHIKMLIDEGHRVDIAFNIEQKVKPEIYNMGCKIHEVPFHRSPLNKGNISAYKKIKELIIAEEYELIHTHTPVASAIVRFACRNLNNTKVFYTAHGFHFYKGAPLINWMIYYPVEKYLSQYTDTLITINKEDYNRAKKRFKTKNIQYIAGVGLEFDRFRNITFDRMSMRKEVGVLEDSFVVLSIGELNKNKNHEVIIKAIKKLDNPRIHYVICGSGSLKSYLTSLSKELGIADNVHLIGFRKDIAEICKSCDVFAFPSLREGLGMAALEAMACGLPIITSNVHGIVDYSMDGETGFSCRPYDVDGFAKYINILINDKTLSEKFSKINIERANNYNTRIILDDLLNNIYNM